MCVTYHPQFKVDRLLATFCVVCALSLIVNPIPSTSLAESRLLFFVMMLGLLSPLIENDILRIIRVRFWDSLMILLSIAVIASCVWYVILIISGTHSGVFTGLFTHHMLLAPIAAITFINALSRLLHTNLKGKFTTIQKITIPFYVLVSLSALLMVIVAGSRAAMLATLFAIILLFWQLRSNPRKLISMIVGLITIVASCWIFTDKLFATATRKFNVAIEHNSLTYSRDELWQARWQEFKDSPIIGIGFAHSTHFSPTWDREKTIGADVSEPGSSWLSILSNTGILGLAIFVWFNLRQVVRMIKKKKDSKTMLFFSLWLLLIVHGFFEGWALYAGSLTFFFYWIIMSQIHNYNNQVCSDEE